MLSRASHLIVWLSVNTDFYPMTYRKGTNPENFSENAIRPFAVERKNWLFSNSVDGANASAVVYTMVEMAKAHGLNIYGYLKFLLEHRPDKDMTDEQMSELAPWSEKLQSIKNRM